MPALEQLWLQQPGDDAGVMQRRPFRAVFFHIKALEEIGQLGDNRAHPSTHLAKGPDPRPCGQRLMRHIQRHHHDLDPGFQHDIGGFGIHMDVEFGRRRDVAHLEIGAAHQHDPLHAAHDIGGACESGGDIGQRPEGAQRDAARGARAQGVDDKIHRMPLLQRHGRFRQVGAIQPGAPMHMLGRDQRPAHGGIAAGKHPHVGPPGQFADLARIQLRQRQRHIAGNGGDAQNLDFRAGQRQQDGHGVILPRIGVDDDLLCHGRPSGQVFQKQKVDKNTRLVHLHFPTLEISPQWSKFTSSTSLSAVLRNVASFIRSTSSGVKLPQDATRSETLAAGFTGYSKLTSA